MDRPKAKGLAPEVGNLLILAFAEQTNRSFYLRGRPHAPTLENLPGELELRLQALPPEEEWEEARRRAREVFGVERFDSALLTAANVAALAGEVQEKAEVVRDACHGLGPGGPPGPGPPGRLGRRDRPGPPLSDRPGGRRARRPVSRTGTRHPP